VGEERVDEARPPETLNLQVYRAIRDRIFRGEWLPGTKLTLRGLAQEMGTSVQPVREALSKLTVERALFLRPNYSFVLPPMETALMDEIFSIRTILEAEAARLYASAMEKSQLDYLEEKISGARRMYRESAKIPERVSAIQSVSMAIAVGSGSSILAEQIVNLRTRTAPYYAAAFHNDDFSDPEFVTFTIKIQDEFVSALKRRDINAAAEIRAVDLYTFQRQIYRLLSLE
jgi:DNA-binding GntR family transcriptional regulator